MDAEAGACRGAIKALVVVFRQSERAAMLAIDSKLDIRGRRHRQGAVALKGNLPDSEIE
jgi:hypothetical protein